VRDNMKAVRIHETGDVDVLKYEDAPKPDKSQLSPDQVLIKLHYGTVNFIDTYFRTGLYKVKEFPLILGQDGSGEVEAVGSNVKDLVPGDKVAVYGAPTYAEYTVADQKGVIKIPDGLSLEEAAACMVNGLTGYYLTHETYRVQKGDFVLVHAAAGGTGQYIVQMAKELGGIIIGTVGSEEKVAIAKEIGCDYVINYKTQDIVQEVLRITNNKKCKVSYDGVGKSTFNISLDSLAPRGWFVSFGNASGAIPPFEPLILSQKGSLIFTRPTLLNYVPDRESFIRMSSSVFDLVKQKKVKVNIHKIFPLNEARQAHLEIQGGKTVGKILLRTLRQI